MRLQFLFNKFDRNVRICKTVNLLLGNISNIPYRKIIFRTLHTVNYIMDKEMLTTTTEVTYFDLKIG
jgi:hypothetical protein